MNTVLRTYQFKLKPSKKQINVFEEWLGICRYVYNNSLSVRKQYLDSFKKQPSSFDLNYQLNDAKKEESLSFLKKVHSDVLTEANERTKKTTDSLFRSWRNGKKSYFKFKNNYTYNSFTFKRGVKVDKNKIKLPKIGEIKYFNSRSIPTNSKIKYCSIIRKNNKWYINIQIELQQQSKQIDENQAIGIDMGVEVHSYLSNGGTIKSPYFLEPSLKKLKTLQRKLQRCDLKSKRRIKVKKQVTTLHEKISRQRKDFNHKNSTELSNTFHTIVIEDLKISKMTKLNSTLSRRMLDNGFFQFRQMLTYKANELIAVNPAYTSQTCNMCKNVDSRNRLSQSEFVCTNCGNIDNADSNASKNILASGRSFRTKRKSID